MPPSAVAPAGSSYRRAPRRARRFGWAFALFASIALPAAAEPLTVIDIARSDAADIARLRQAAARGWWLEMGDHFVVAGDHDRQALTTDARRVLQVRADIDPQRLRLRARGCSDHAPERGVLIARGARWELRLLSEIDLVAASRDDAHVWQPVPRNASIAQRFRIDAAAKGALAADAAIQAVVDRIDAERWFGDVETLAAWDRHSRATTSLEAARDWIAAQFSSLQLQVTLAPFDMPGAGGSTITRHNVIGSVSGSMYPDRWVIVGAHYDSRNIAPASVSPTPGAEDNATGCAGVIELARALLPSQPARSIAFICYSGEEQGLRGSYAHVNALNLAGELGRVDLVVIMDMIGYSADAQFEALFESSASQTAYLSAFGSMAAIYAPQLAVVTSTMPFGSDHVPYIESGLRSALAIENDWDVYPHYHEVTDTPANLGPHARAMGEAILRTNAAVIADLGGLYVAPFRDGFEDPS